MDQEGNIALLHACSRVYMECANMLLKPIGRDEVSLETNQLHEVLDQRNHKGEHCLHLTTFKRHYEIIRSRSEAGEAKAVRAGPCLNIAFLVNEGR